MCKFDGRKCNLNQKWNNNKCRKTTHLKCEKDHV